MYFCFDDDEMSGKGKVDKVLAAASEISQTQQTTKEMEQSTLDTVATETTEATTTTQQERVELPSQFASMFTQRILTTNKARFVPKRFVF